jgi:heme exporter protein A
MRLTATGLSAERGGRQVFADVSFTVGSGELLAVIGPNGAGKSTLLRLICGLLPAAAGTVVLEDSPPPERARSVGEARPEGADAADLANRDTSIGENAHYLGHLDALKPGLTVRQNLDFWRRLWGGGDIEVALDAVGLEPLGDLPASVLSAGQRRRVALARLLVARRPLWLLDEPTTALDTAAEDGLGRLIADHLASGGLAIAATHRDLPATPAATLTLGTT